LTYTVACFQNFLGDRRGRAVLGSDATRDGEIRSEGLVGAVEKDAFLEVEVAFKIPSFEGLFEELKAKKRTKGGTGVSVQGAESEGKSPVWKRKNLY